MSKSRNREVVEGIYAAFGRGDVPAILEVLADDVRWDAHYGASKVPWLTARAGRAGAAAFFSAVGEHLAFEKFEVEAILESGSLLVALVNLEAKVKSTGKTLRERREVHVWELDERGRVVDFQHGADTLQHWQALGEPR